MEDEALIALAEKLTLERHGFRVVLVRTGEEAVNTAEGSSRIDLILMDINLGKGIDGTQAALLILEKRDLPLVFLSSHTESDVVEKTEGITSYGYIVKNSGETVLLASIKMAFKLFEARMIDKLKEDELRRSEERYKSIIAASKTGAWEYHLDTGYVWCSPEYFQMLGLEPSMYVMDGHPNLQEVWLDIMHPEDRETASRTFADYLSKGSAGMYECIFRMRHKDGHWVRLYSRGQVLRNPDGSRSNLMVGTHIDINDRKLPE